MGESYLESFNFAKIGSISEIEPILANYPGNNPGICSLWGSRATTAVSPPTPTTPQATATLAPLSTIDLGQTAVPTPVSAPPTLTPPIQPSATIEPPTALPKTAVVSSGVGVWLRRDPGTSGEQLEWLLDGAVLTILAGTQQVDGYEWQHVLSAAGIEGWVAVDFIVYNE